MTSWPDKPLILIKKGRESRLEVRDTVAVATDIDCKGEDYYLLNGSRAGCTILRSCSTDDIDAWEEVTAVPTAALKRLQDAFRGVDVIRSLEPPLLEVLSHLPADKPNALDRAAAMVEDMGGPMISAETPPAERLSLLLDALASVQSETRKAIPLAMVARICVDWVDVEDRGVNSLEAVQRSVDALFDSGDFIVLSALVADVITAMGENIPPRHDLIDAGAYALAWAAQIIEEEDK